MKWTDEEVLILKTMCQWHTIPELAERLGRTEAGVKGKLQALGIRLRDQRGYLSRPKTWTDKDVKYLISSATIGTKTKTIAKRLGKSEKAVRLKASKLGVSLQKTPWSNYQLDTLEEMVNRGEGWEDISKKIGKSRASCMKKATDLMLEKNRKRGWSEEEIQMLISLRDDGVSYRKIANQLGRTYEAVRKHYVRILKGEIR